MLSELLSAAILLILVIDPFGNLLGVMYNQHYLDVLTSRQAG